MAKIKDEQTVFRQAALLIIVLVPIFFVLFFIIRATSRKPTTSEFSPVEQDTEVSVIEDRDDLDTVLFELDSADFGDINEELVGNDIDSESF